MGLRTVPADTLDIAKHIRPGDLVSWGQALAEPVELVQRYIDARHRIGPTRAMLGLQFGTALTKDHADAITPISYGALGSVARLHRAGVLKIIPCRYGQLPDLISSGRLRPDVMLVQLSPPGPDGTHSLGWTNDTQHIAMAHARVVLAEINPSVPWTRMDRPLDESRITAAIHSDRTLAAPPNAVPGPLDAAIAAHLTPHIPEGATLQYGVGAIPAAILNGLRSHRDLGLHSGLVTEDVLDLIECGAMTNARKPLLPGIGVCAVAVGGPRLAGYITDNQAFRLCEASYTHGIATLAALDNLVAINSALEVDLRGQVNAEQVGSRYLGAIGGQPDFMQAATSAPRGLSVIALPSTSGRDDRVRSRIVANLTGPQVTTARYDVDVVVTEHGLADLRGLDVAQRALALIQIAAPDWREELSRTAHDTGLTA